MKHKTQTQKNTVEQEVLGLGVPTNLSPSPLPRFLSLKHEKGIHHGQQMLKRYHCYM